MLDKRGNDKWLYRSYDGGKTWDVAGRELIWEFAVETTPQQWFTESADSLIYDPSGNLHIIIASRYFDSGISRYRYELLHYRRVFGNPAFETRVSVDGVFITAANHLLRCTLACEAVTGNLYFAHPTYATADADTIEMCIWDGAGEYWYDMDIARYALEYPGEFVYLGYDALIMVEPAIVMPLDGTTKPPSINLIHTVRANSEVQYAARLMALTYQDDAGGGWYNRDAVIDLYDPMGELEGYDMQHTMTDTGFMIAFEAYDLNDTYIDFFEFTWTGRVLSSRLEIPGSRGQGTSSMWLDYPGIFEFEDGEMWMFWTSSDDGTQVIHDLANEDTSVLMRSVKPAGGAWGQAHVYMGVNDFSIWGVMMLNRPGVYKWPGRSFAFFSETWNEDAYVGNLPVDEALLWLGDENTFGVSLEQQFDYSHIPDIALYEDGELLSGGTTDALLDDIPSESRIWYKKLVFENTAVTPKTGVQLFVISSGNIGAVEVALGSVAGGYDEANAAEYDDRAMIPSLAGTGGQGAMWIKYTRPDTVTLGLNTVQFKIKVA